MVENLVGNLIDSLFHLARDLQKNLLEGRADEVARVDVHKVVGRKLFGRSGCPFLFLEIELIDLFLGHFRFT